MLDSDDERINARRLTEGYKASAMEKTMHMPVELMASLTRQHVLMSTELPDERGYI